MKELCFVTIAWWKVCGGVILEWRWRPFPLKIEGAKIGGGGEAFHEKLAAIVVRVFQALRMNFALGDYERNPGNARALSGIAGLGTSARQSQIKSPNP